MGVHWYFRFSVKTADNSYIMVRYIFQKEVSRGAVLKYEVRSLIFMRRCDDTDFFAIIFKMEASTNIKYFELEKSRP